MSHHETHRPASIFAPDRGWIPAIEIIDAITPESPPWDVALQLKREIGWKWADFYPHAINAIAYHAALDAERTEEALGIAAQANWNCRTELAAGHVKTVLSKTGRSSAQLLDVVASGLKRVLNADSVRAQSRQVLMEAITGGDVECSGYSEDQLDEHGHPNGGAVRSSIDFHRLRGNADLNDHNHIVTTDERALHYSVHLPTEQIGKLLPVLHQRVQDRLGWPTDEKGEDTVLRVLADDGSSEATCLARGSTNQRIGHTGDAAERRNDISGFWIIPEAIAWIVFGDAQRRLPDPGDPHYDLVAVGEKSFIGAIRTCRIAATGIHQENISRPVDGDPERIAATKLLMHVTISTIALSPRGSWLMTFDNATGRGRHIWRDVRVEENEARSLWPIPLIKGTTEAEEHHATPLAVADGPLPISPATEAQIHQAIEALYDAAEAGKMKPPNVKEAPELVKKRLERKGLTATYSRIQQLADEPRHKLRRRPPGPRVYGSLLPFLDTEM